MALRYNPKIITDNLVLNLDPSHNKSYPTDLPVKDGLVMWMDAADDTTFSYSSGTTVSQWRDKSSSGYHMTPKSGGPTRSAFLNSRKVLAFTTSQTIGNNTINLSSSANTVFVISRLTGTTNGRVLTCNADASGNNWLLGHHGGTVNDYYAEGWVYDSATTADTTWRIFMGDWSGSSTDLANFYSNGTAVTTNSSGASQGPNKLGVNYYSAETSTCEVAEIIVFNKVLSSVERKLVHTYLGQKWGISNTDRSGIDLASSSTNTWLLGDGTTANMPQYSVYNKTFNFDGSNDIISYPYNLGTYSSYSFCFWARRNAENKMALSSYGNSSFYWFGDNSWAYTHGGVVGEKYYSKSVSIPLGSYGHYCVTYDGTTVKIYRNSVLEDSQATTGTAVFSAGLQLGKYGSSSDYMFNGDISNFLMYSKALSASEISDIYESQKSRFINYIVTQGLVLNLDAGNPYSYAGSGSTIYDVSGSANNGTLNNSPTYSSDSNGILLFNGSSQYVGIANSSSLQVADTFTVSAWVKATDLSNRYGVFSTRANNTTGCWQFEVGTGSGGTGRVVLTGIGTYISESVSNVITTNTWYHITVVKVNNATQGATFYVNGSAVSNVGTAAYTISNNSDEKRIAIGTGSAQYFPGYIAQTFVYNRALSASEVIQNYNATKGRFGL